VTPAGYVAIQLEKERSALQLIIHQQWHIRSLLPAGGGRGSIPFCNDSVHMSTVAGTFPDKPRQGYWNVGMPSNELQLSSVGGTTRWQFTSSAAAGHTNVPSQVEVHRTSPPTSDQGDNCLMSESAASSSHGATNLDYNHRMLESTVSSSCSINVEVNPGIPPNMAGSSNSSTYSSPLNGNDSDNENECSQDFCRNADALLRAADSASVLRNVTNIPNRQVTCDVPEWDGCNTDFILKLLKSIPREELEAIGKRDFYKSYSSWARMTVDKRNKMLSYFRSLPEELQGTFDSLLFTPIIHYVFNSFYTYHL